MYIRRVKCKRVNLESIFHEQRQWGLPHFRSNKVSDLCTPSSTEKGACCKSGIGSFFPRRFAFRGSYLGIDGAKSIQWPCSTLSRFYSSESDGSNGNEGKHVPIKNAPEFDQTKKWHGEVKKEAGRCDEHARLGQQDQKEWLDNEKLSFDSQKKESPFLTKRERFKNEFLRRVVPPEKITVSWDNFPYYINQHTRNLLVECAASHLKHKQLAKLYGARLNSSSGRILLQGIPGTELYRERMVRALAKDLDVPLLVIDSSVYAPHVFGQECASESESDDENVDSEECASYSEAEEEVSNEGDSDEAKSNESDEDNTETNATAVVLNKIIPCSIDEFAKRISGAFDSESASNIPESEAAKSEKKPTASFRKGDRVKYVGPSVNVEVDNRILLGKIPTSDGPASAYTQLSGRSISSGQRGEVFEVNGDQVAVILDSDKGKDEVDRDSKIAAREGRPSIYWIDVTDIAHDDDVEAQDWHIAMEVLHEILPSLEPIIIYFPDSLQWASKTVQKGANKEFLEKLEEMLDQLSGHVLLIYGQNKIERGTREKERMVVLPQFGRLGRLPIPLHQLTGGFRSNKGSKVADIGKVFSNALCIDLPKDEEEIRTFRKQLEEDKKFIISRNNLIELQKVLDEHQLLCSELLHINTDGVSLTSQKAKRVVGWARNHYLSSSISPSVKGDRLNLPIQSLEIAISRLKEQEAVSKKPSLSLKTIAKDEYESNFISAVVPPGEIGVKFEDIGALEDVKRTLNELVTLPMRRPELFSHGNLLRPCKGLLLFGPPGTGKTLLAKALATEAGANFLSITGSTLTSKWFGDAEKLTKALFSFASKLAPVIIFVDEIDSLLGARGGAFEHEATRRMRNEFMAAWDGLRSKDSQRILVLGATNRPFDLDDAVIRRLPRRIYVDLPDPENRMKILNIFLAQENLHTSFKYEDLANETEGYSGSDLKNLCIAAAYMPVQELLEEEAQAGVTKSVSSLRPLIMDDFIHAKTKVGASVAYDATSMNELRKWNEQYGEGGSRRRSPFGFGG